MGADAVKLPPLPPGFKVDSFENDEIPPLPEGYTLDKEPAAEQGPRKSPAQMRQEYLQAQYGTAKTPLADAAMSIASQGVSVPASGLVGLVGSMVPGPEGQGARWAEKTREILGRVLPTEPTTPGGQVVTEGASYPFEKWGELGKYVGEKRQDMGGSPLSATLAETTLGAIPYVVSRGARGRVAKGMQENAAAMSRNAVADATLKAAQDEGYVVQPTTKLGKAATSVAGEKNVLQEAALRNQEVTNKIARREAGLMPDEAIDDAALEAARNRMAGPYREVAAMSPVAEKALQDLREARSSAKKWRRYYERSADPRAETKAERFEKEAERNEQLIDSIAQGSKNPKLLGELRDARKAIAKNYEVERAVNPGDGNVDARALARRLKSGAYMTGGLETIAKFSNAYPKVTRPGASVGVPGAGHDMALESLIGGIEGARHFGPKGAVVGAGIPLLRGPMRGLALSRPLQPGPTAPSLGLKLGDIATRPAATGALALTPALGLKVPREESQ